MARIVYGALGSRWSAPEWVFRNVWREVVAAVRRMPGREIVAERLAALGAGNVAVIDLAAILEDRRDRSAWLQALDIAAVRVGAEDAHDWNEPQALGPYVGSLRRLVAAERAPAEIDAAHAVPDPVDVVVATLPWILDDRLD